MRARRLLLISYFYPPANLVGARRPAALARWLPAHGWEVDVVTAVPAPPDAGGPRRYEVPHRPWIERLHEAGVRPDRWFRAPPEEHVRAGVVDRPSHLSARVWRLVRASAYQAATFPDRTIGWSRPARAAAGDAARTRVPDAVLSTSPPETVHFVARSARRTARCAWVADLRDPWSTTHLADRPAWRRRLDAMVERSILSEADALITVSDPIAERMERLHGRPVVTIQNGFDPELFPGPETPDRSVFRLVYAGLVTVGRHDLPALVGGAARFLEVAHARGEAPPLELCFLGETSPAVVSAFVRAGLERRAKFLPRVPHAEAAAAIRRSAANVFLSWQDPLFPGVLTGKLFEYLGARRPVLSVGADPGVAGELLERSGAGRHARDAQQVAERLDELWRSHREGRDAWRPSEERVLAHSHERMAASFARVLDDVLARCVIRS